jgi:hypothetical protein
MIIVTDNNVRESATTTRKADALRQMSPLSFLPLKSTLPLAAEPIPSCKTYKEAMVDNNLTILEFK